MSILASFWKPEVWKFGQKLVENAKISNATFWVIFKQCDDDSKKGIIKTSCLSDYDTRQWINFACRQLKWGKHWQPPYTRLGPVAILHLVKIKKEVRIEIEAQWVPHEKLNKKFNIVHSVWKSPKKSHCVAKTSLKYQK